MSLYDEILSDLVGTADLSVILRKAKVLAYKLKNKEFKDWIENEFNGYKDSALMPQYRKLSTISQANFWNGHWQIDNQVVPMSLIPEEYRGAFNQLYVHQGIKELESMSESMNKKGEDVLPISIPAEFFRFLDYTLFDNLQCLRAWRLLSKSQIDQIIDSTRNNLLDFVLELGEKFPEIKSDDDLIRPIPNDQLRQIFISNIVGSTNSLMQGDNMSVFDQRNQKVDTQYNAAGNININNPQDFLEAIQSLLTLIENSSLNTAQKINAKSDVQIIRDLADLDRSPEVVALANSKIEAVKEVISMTADMTSLGMVLIPVLHAAFGN